jgi:hypothetical protein
VQVFKTKEFARFARREAIRDETLLEAAVRAERGLIDADLGGGLIKQRVARPGQGRRGGFRTLMAFRAGGLTVFVYGFAENERGNTGPEELNFWCKVAEAFVRMDDARPGMLLAEREIMEVVDDG